MDENLTFLINDNIYLNINSSNLEAILGPKRDNLRVVITMTVIYAIIFLSGIIGNVSTCIVIVTNKSMHTATNYYLLNLAISDLLLLVSGLPQEMYSIWSRYPYIFGYAFCILRGLFAETSANATVLTVTAFTVERYVAICHPFLSHTLSKLSRIIKLIFVIWLIAFCSAIPQALQFGVTRFVDDVPESDMCQVVNPIMMHSFELSTFLFFVAPMTLITVLYVLIGIRLRKSTTLIKKNQKECKKTKGKRSVYYNRNYKQQNTQSSRKIVKMLVAVVVAFFICWAPFHAQRLIAIYMTYPTRGSEKYIFLKIYEITTYISGILYYLSTTINPLLYNVMSNKFREAFRKTFSRWFCVSRGRRLQQNYIFLPRTSQQPGGSTDSGRDEYSIHLYPTSMNQDKNIEPACSYSTSTQRFNRMSPYKCNSLCSLDKQTVAFMWISTRSNIQLAIIPREKCENMLGGAAIIPVPQTTSDKLLRCLRDISGKPNANGNISVHRTSTTTRNGNTKVIQSEEINIDTCSLSSSEISNSSLKNVDNELLRDELMVYENETCFDDIVT